MIDKPPQYEPKEQNQYLDDFEPPQKIEVLHDAKLPCSATGDLPRRGLPASEGRVVDAARTADSIVKQRQLNNTWARDCRASRSKSGPARSHRPAATRLCSPGPLARVRLTAFLEGVLAVLTRCSGRPRDCGSRGTQRHAGTRQFDGTGLSCANQCALPRSIWPCGKRAGSMGCWKTGARKRVGSPA